MKKFFSALLYLLPLMQAVSQQSDTLQRELSTTDFSALDSLERALPQVTEDTLKAIMLNDLAFAYAFSNAEKGLSYAQKGFRISQEAGYPKGIAFNTLAMGTASWTLGNYENALQHAFNALHLFEALGNDEQIGRSSTIISIVYRDVGDYKSALLYSRKALEYLTRAGQSQRIPYANLGSIYELQNRLDSAYYFTQKAHELDLKINSGKWDWVYWILGNIETKRKNYPAALSLYRQALSLGMETTIYKSVVEAYNGIAQVHKEMGNPDSCIYYAKEVLQKWKFVSYQKGVLLAARMLADAYKAKNIPDSAIRYLELSVELNDRLFNQQQVRNIQNLAFNEQIKQDTIERERKEFNNKLKIYGLLITGIFLVAIALVLWRNIQHRKKAYNQLQNQKAETDLQKYKAESTLRDLQATQAQLIQSEKMASLGELTAGIAHEIQNPLNFVNNFSEVNTELISELVDEADKGNTEEVKIIANDIKQNLEKINHHGKRADGIVKGMLQHSRTSTGQKEATDINALADEYLRLAYHGIRAKDKTFNVTIQTDFDSSIGKINIIPQDIGRVLLNLYNNAFYAVREKATSCELQAVSYEPTVIVSTKKLGNRLEIRVTDNGNGIPKNIVDKIFQPFFTTKPTGQGTGLGLSLAYDIVKAHGGELSIVSGGKAETGESKGSEFIIQLPIA